MNLHNYFISLEKRFSELSEYVEIHEDNYGVYSNTIGLLLLSTCAEFEIVCKEISKLVGYYAGNIRDIFDVLSSLEIDDERGFNILMESISMEYFKISFKPFENWHRERSPFWWKAYNGFKHDRVTKYKDANLKSVIYSLGALSIINHYYIWLALHKTHSRDAPVMEMSKIPEIFTIDKVNYYGPVLASDFFDQ